MPTLNDDDFSLLQSGMSGLDEILRGDFRTMADAMPQLAWAAQPDGFIKWYNRRWYEYTGTTPEQMEGWGWQSVHVPELLPQVMAQWKASLATGKPFEMEFPLRGADGTFRRFLTRGMPLKDEEGRVVLWFGTNTDVEDLKRAEEEIKDARQSAEQARSIAETANRAKDRFLAFLSHELRTPLTPIQAAAQLLVNSQKLSEDHQNLANMIHRNVELEVLLIDDLLDLTRIAHNKLELRQETIDLHRKINNVVTMCGAEFAAKQIQVAVTLEAPVHHMQADPARIQQVIWNLFKNAIKFTPAGGCVGIQTSNPSPNLVVVEVTDSGVGIAAESLPHIFDAFEQGGRTVTQQFGGLGLGLAIVKAVVEAHGGTIAAASEGPGKGATFRVTLPAIVHVKTSGQNQHPAALTKLDCTILLVEDHPDTRKIMAQLLTHMGCCVTTAGSVTEALQLAAKQHFSLMISDIGLPDGTGTELMQLMKSKYGMKGIALSGYGMETDRLSSRNAGFEIHLTKPVNIKGLEEAVRGLASQPH